MNRYTVDCELCYQVSAPTEFLFAIEAGTDRHQRIEWESLEIEGGADMHRSVDGRTGNRLLKTSVAPGELVVRYGARVDLTRRGLPAGAREVPVAELPVDVVPYLWPSRYIESDLLAARAQRLFGQQAAGRQRVHDVAQWLHDTLRYELGSTAPCDSARDVLVKGAGVCRDFAHVGIAMCRGLNVPARFVTGYTWYPDPPPDFHAVFEVYLEGGWFLCDATRLAPETQLIRIATGMDASECAFATLFGAAQLRSWRPDVSRPVPIDSLAGQASDPSPP